MTRHALRFGLLTKVALLQSENFVGKNCMILTEDDIQMLVSLNDEFIVADHGCSLSCVRMLWTVG